MSTQKSIDESSQTCPRSVSNSEQFYLLNHAHNGQPFRHIDDWVKILYDLYTKTNPLVAETLRKQWNDMVEEGKGYPITIQGSKIKYDVMEDYKQLFLKQKEDAKKV